MNKFKKGDQVLIIAGSSKGKTGKISTIAGDKITVEGANLATVHKKPTQSNPGQIVKIEKPIHISNVSHVENGKAVKIRFVIESGEKKLSLEKIEFQKNLEKKIG